MSRADQSLRRTKPKILSCASSRLRTYQNMDLFFKECFILLDGLNFDTICVYLTNAKAGQT